MTPIHEAAYRGQLAVYNDLIRLVDDSDDNATDSGDNDNVMVMLMITMMFSLSLMNGMFNNIGMRGRMLTYEMHYINCLLTITTSITEMHRWMYRWVN